MTSSIASNDIQVNANRDFKGIWIPREIWLAKGLSNNEKILWAEIHSLHNRDRGGCFASNEYLMNFMDIKERRLQEMISNLKSFGLVVQVSFDGRERVIKAVVPPEGFEVRRAEVQKSAPLGCGKVHPSGAVNRTPPIYIDNKEDNKEYITPPIPPQKEIAKAKSAKADEEILDSSKAKKGKAFPPEAKELVDQMIECLKSAKPNYVPPKILNAFLTYADYLLRIDGRDCKLILEVFRWALADHFWVDKMFKLNPAEALRKHFDQLEMRMNAKAPINKNQIDRRLKDKAGNAVDEYKDLMF